MRIHKLLQVEHAGLPSPLFFGGVKAYDYLNRDLIQFSIQELN